VAHAALLGLLMVGPAFQRPRNELLLDGPPLELMPGDLLDAPALQQAPPANAEPAPPAPTPVVREPEPTPQPPRRETPPAPPPAPVTPRVEPKPETPAPAPKPAQTQTPTPKPREKVSFDFSKATTVKPQTSSSRAREEEARAQALQRQIARAAGSLRSSSAQPTTVSISGGGGGSANARHVRAAYDIAWITPQGVKDAAATTEVEVVIRGDGTVASARIVKRSGIAALDKSVEEALRKVTRIRPFEAFDRDEQITFTIGFNLQARNLF
jgi:TonB family protein